MSFPIFPFLLAFRIINALSIQTYFQADEYYQALEPALKTAFGNEINPYLTWEWNHQLRSSLHPLFFALAYRVADAYTNWFAVSLATRSQILLAAPKVLQAVFAAGIDDFTLRLARRVYGSGSRVASVTLILSLLNPWQFFCSVRTFSNSLETTLTAGALSFWPWSPHGTSDHRQKSTTKPEQTSIADSISSLNGLRISLALAALAVVLRPTNILIWLPLGLHLFLQSSSRSRFRLISEAALIGSSVFGLSILVDHSFYGIWTIPTIQFVYINVSKRIAEFYGRMRLDYYFTEGLGLLLTTSLPFALYGLYQNTIRKALEPRRSSSLSDSVPALLSWTVTFVLVVLTTISHKEVRFIYPLLPALHIIAAQPLATFISRKAKISRVIIPLLLSANVVFTVYISFIHQRGVIDVTHYLRQKHESQMLLDANAITTVGIFMPCHSTPWRSHLIHPGIDIWALTCEPPLDVPLEARANYLDEADHFYASPITWMKDHMAKIDGFHSGRGEMSRREWPDNIVFFEHLEPILRTALDKTAYHECWRGFNTHWHDDSRRKGDVIVWCKD